MREESGRGYGGSGTPGYAETVLELPQIVRHPLRCGALRLSKKSVWRAAALIAVHALIVAHVAHWKISGTTPSPMEPSEAATTLELGYVNAGFVLFAALIGSTLLVGRFFCGWACHLVAYQDLCAWLLKKVGLRPLPVRSRLLAFVPVYAALDMFLWPALQRTLAGAPPPEFKGWALTTENLWERFPGLWVTVATVVVCGGLMVWWLGAKGFCTYGCPYGVIFGLADRVAPGRIRVTDACEGCGHCTAACTSNVRVHEEVRLYRQVVDSGCMKCLDCVSVCPKEALYVGFGLPSLLAPRPANRPARTWDFTWFEEIWLAVIFAVGLWVFRGLYHQVPFLLAIGLAVLLAFSVVLSWRFLRTPSVRFQHLTLKTDGKWTLAGLASVLLFVSGSGLALHSGWIRLLTVQGEFALREAQAASAPETAPIRAEARARALEALLASERLGLFDDGILQFQLAAIYNDLQDIANVEARLRRALESDPAMTSASLRLANLLGTRGDVAGAVGVLERAVQETPWDARLRSMLDAARAAQYPK